MVDPSVTPFLKWVRSGLVAVWPRSLGGGTLGKCLVLVVREVPPHGPGTAATFPPGVQCTAGRATEANAVRKGRVALVRAPLGVGTTPSASLLGSRTGLAVKGQEPPHLASTEGVAVPRVPTAAVVLPVVGGGRVVLGPRCRATPPGATSMVGRVAVVALQAVVAELGPLEAVESVGS